LKHKNATQTLEGTLEELNTGYIKRLDELAYKIVEQEAVTANQRNTLQNTDPSELRAYLSGIRAGLNFASKLLNEERVAAQYVDYSK
jgi:hypothetical protein